MRARFSKHFPVISQKVAQNLLEITKFFGFLPINKGVPQGTILGPIPFSVMLNYIEAVDSDSSTLAKFGDDLTISVLVKGIQDQAPQEV